VTLALVAAFGLGLAASQQARPASAPTMSVDDALKALRNDLQTSRADLIAKNVTLTSEQAAKFWPVFEKYQKEQSAIMDEQLKGVQKYAEAYQTLDDATALSLLKTHLERDAKMTALRQTWLAEFQQVLPVRLAVRVLQIDRRISLAQQIEIASQIPLVQ
jgi:Spy/CpxP family protein refolding chaperone